MKYISIQTYNNEFAPRGEKLRLFYNPDNTVAIFEESDSDLWKYVFEKGFELKEAGFCMNREAADSIREYLAEQKEANFTALEDLKPVAEILKPSSLLFSEENFNDLISRIDSKPSVAKLAEILKEVLFAIQAR